MLRWLLLLPLLAGCATRDPARIGGDPGGVPVAVTVRYEPSALPALTGGAGFQRTVVIERGPWPDPWLYGPGPFPHRCAPWGFRGGFAAGWGPDYAYEPATTLDLLLGRGPAEGQYLRLELREGGWSGSVPIAAGTEVVASIQGSGGRAGWKEIGRFTAAAGLRVTVRLEGAEPRIETQTPAP